MQIAIQPYQITKAGLTGSAVFIALTNGGDLDAMAQTVRFDFQLTDSTGNILQRGNASLSQDQYNAWSSQVDSTYLPSCIAINLGLTPTTS